MFYFLELTLFLGERGEEEEEGEAHDGVGGTGETLNLLDTVCVSG